MRKKLRFMIGMAIVLTGIGIYLYPNLRVWELNQRTSDLISGFKEMYPKETDGATENLSEERSDYQNLYNEMLEYNNRLITNGQELVDAWSYAQEPIDLEELSNEDDAVGYIEIPAMDVILPLYIGATAENMAKGAAIMSETSMPIGGTDTNCVIAGHRGYSGMPYFRDIEKLKTGDRVYITNVWETLIYEVKQTSIIEPDDIASVLIVPGKDMVTLLTCHPYMSHGKYRYVVYCERVEEGDDTKNIMTDSLDPDSGSGSPDAADKIMDIFSSFMADLSEPVIFLEKILRILIPAGIILCLVRNRKKHFSQ